MSVILIIALAAGAASATMFASINSGALISLLLVYLAPLPLMVAAIAWGPISAAIGGIGASAVLGAIFGPVYGLAYTISVALPAWWLGHLALLGRPRAAAPSVNGLHPNGLEWYPLGRILLWIAGLAGLTTFAALLTLGADAATITATVRRFLLGILERGDVIDSGEVEQWLDWLVVMAFAGAAIVATTTLTLNLWLAAKVAATSGRLRRPWPDLPGAVLPTVTLVLLCAGAAFCFSGGLVAILAQTVTAALMMAYAFTGFAVLHTLTWQLKGRAFWLCSAYAIVLALEWPVIAVALLGLADAVFGLRARYWRTRPPRLPEADVST
jgi:hypothetical protein